jgi:hypothetical protein
LRFGQYHGDRYRSALICATESLMADEVFALSPISARAVQPSEADYDAIRDAFMETSRGRWFLGEYAKRNRNADTSMVLDAVARIEEALAAQRQVPPVDDKLPEALAAIRGAVDRAAETARAAFDRAAVEASLAPIHKGLVIIKEISWRWREIGADGRICDLIDSQLSAIEAGCGQIAQIDPYAALKAAFEEIKATLDEFIEDDGASPVEQAGATAPSPVSESMTWPAAADDEAISANDAFAEPAAMAQPAPEQDTIGHAEAAALGETFAEQDVIASSAIEEDVGEAAVDTPAAEVFGYTEPAPETMDAGSTYAEADAQADAEPDAAQADAHDEAVLELVAAEMAAPDPIEIDDFDPIGDDIVVTRRTPEPIETMPKPAATPVRPPIVQPFPQPTLSAVPQPAPVVARGPSPVPPPVEPSLGSTIIANGILQPAKPATNDPLAPIRRMSQAEKIAFFS